MPMWGTCKNYLALNSSYVLRAIIATQGPVWVIWCHHSHYVQFVPKDPFSTAVAQVFNHFMFLLFNFWSVSLFQRNILVSSTYAHSSKKLKVSVSKEVSANAFNLTCDGSTQCGVIVHLDYQLVNNYPIILTRSTCLYITLCYNIGIHSDFTILIFRVDYHLISSCLHTSHFTPALLLPPPRQYVPFVSRIHFTPLSTSNYQSS